MNQKEADLLAALRSDIDSSTGTKSYKKLNQARVEVMKRYMMEKYGNEIPGRSSIVTSEVSDTVEAMLPQIMKMFVSSEKVVNFDPVGPEDEAAARQETAYVNHVFYKDNPGLEILHCWFKDALSVKVGFVKYYWDESKEVITETYQGLTDQELMALLSDPNVEVEDQEQRVEAIPVPGMEEVFQTVTDVNIKRTNKKGRVRVESVPYDEILMDAEYTGMHLQDIPFIGHETTTTLSDLRAQGFSESVLKDIEDYAVASEGVNENYEKEQRFRDISDDPYQMSRSEEVDVNMRPIKLTECYKRYDYDGDGYSELRRVLLVSDSKIIENEEFDYVPFESICSIPVPHRFFGLSPGDQVAPLQDQKTSVVRNILDNLYLTNNVRMGVVEGEVNYTEALDSKPGGIVRMSQPGMLFPIPVQPFSGQTYGFLEYLDTVKEQRTGATRYNQGMDSNSLNKTAHGIDQIMEASAARMELIARLFGEGLKRLMLGVHRLLLQNQDQARVVQITGQYVPINPSEWRERTNMTVVVGLGTGNKDKTLGHLMNVFNVQKELMQGGAHWITPENLHATASKIIENSGLKNPEVYFTPPQMVPPPPPPPPDPQVELLKMQLQVQQQQAQTKEMDSQRSYDIEMRKLALDEQKMRLEAQKVALQDGKLQLEQATAVDASVDRTLDRELEARSMELDAMVKASEPRAPNGQQ